MPRGFSDLAKLDATAQLQALASRRISAVELLEVGMAANETLKSINAVVARDVETARERARAIDDRRAKGEGNDTLGPLAGLPITLKDTIDVQGLPASSGRKHMLNRTAFDAPVVHRVRQAGAVIWGKTNSGGLAGDWQTFNGLYGTTNNPWDERRTAGGSSGGAAAALATGIVAMEIGSDIGGDLRGPASFCGVCAHRPTFGMVNTLGHVPPDPGSIAPTDMSVIGPMARSARDLRLLLSIMTEAPMPARAPAANLAETRIGLWLDEPLFDLDPAVAARIERFAAELKMQGAAIEPIKSPVDAETLMEAFGVLLLSTAGARDVKLRRRLEWRRGPAKMARHMGAGPLSWAGQILSMTARHSDWLEANEAREHLSAVMGDVFEAYAVIICPTAPVPAFPHDHRTPYGRRKLKASDGALYPYDALWSWTALASVCGLPATAIPAGLTPGGLPVGVQVIGPRGGDSRTLAVAQAIEDVVGGFTTPPSD